MPRKKSAKKSRKTSSQSSSQPKAKSLPTLGEMATQMGVSPEDLLSMFSEKLFPTEGPAGGARKSSSQHSKEADRLFERALQAKSKSKARELLTDLLKKYPHHCDALQELAYLTENDQEALKLLKQLVAIHAEEVQEELQNDVGLFWGLLETRPYMRARQMLAERYLEAGELQKAAEEMADLIRLNPNDNQGIRWMLMEVYCRLQQFDQAETLVDSFPEDGFPFVSFTALLLQFRKTGDTPELQKAVQEQNKENPHIIPRLLDPERIDLITPIKMFSPGSPEEADLYCRQFLSVWRSIPGAIPWLGSLGLSQAAKNSPSSLSTSATDWKKELQRLRPQVKKLPQSPESWFFDFQELPDDDENWLATILELADEELVWFQPGESPLQADTVLLAIFEAMLDPETGEPRRPQVIEFMESDLVKKVSARLKSLGIALSVVPSRPEVLNRMRQVTGTNDSLDSIDLEAIKSAPQRNDVWEIDWRPLDQWFPGENGELIQPWLLLIAHEKSQAILAQRMSQGPPESLLIENAIQDAILKPAVGEPGRPSQIRVPNTEHQLDLSPFATEFGVPCSSGPCETLEELYEEVAQITQNTQQGPPPMSSLPGVSPEVLGDFFAAAAEYYQSKLWLGTHPQTIIEVRCPDLLPQPMYAVIIGQMGQELGVIYFENLKHVKKLMRLSGEEPGEGAGFMNGLTLSFNDKRDLSPEDCAAAEQFGWPVVDDSAWPQGIAMAGGDFQSLMKAEFQFITAATRGVTELLKTGKTALKVPVKLHDQTIDVQLKRHKIGQ